MNADRNQSRRTKPKSPTYPAVTCGRGVVPACHSRAGGGPASRRRNLDSHLRGNDINDRNLTHRPEARRLRGSISWSFVLASDFDIRISNLRRMTAYRRLSAFISGSEPFGGAKEPSSSRRQTLVAVCSVMSQWCNYTAFSEPSQPNCLRRGGIGAFLKGVRPFRISLDGRAPALYDT